MSQPHTIVEYFAEHEGYRCGYCGKKDTNFSHVMWAHQMSVQDYQDLIDRGWRRSGKTVYKPTMNVMCCPHYTIRCRAQEFKPSKSHKKQIKRINRYLITGIKPGGDGNDETEEDANAAKESQPGSANSTESRVLPTDVNSSDTATGSAVGIKTHGQTSEKHIPKPGSGADSNKPKCRKAKELRAERKAMKMSLDETSAAPKKKAKQNAEKTLEELLSEPENAENPAHKLEIRLCRSAPVPSELRSSFKESYHVYKKYQMAVHKDPPEDCDIKGFQGFLVDSPLKEQHGENAPPMGYGSFHQQYLIDGKIVAVGVVDILPSCVSSKYLYYDPDYSFLGLGVYTALREVAFVRELQRSAPSLKYYYMGFYIHSCSKMRYKAQYHPSDLVCPESYCWVPVPQCLPKLDASPYSRLSDDSAVDKDKDININKVLVLCHGGKVMPYALYKMMSSGETVDDSNVTEYAGLVGKTCAERMFLVRQ